MRMSKSKAAPVKMTAAGFAIAERAYKQIAMELQQRLTARGTTSDVWYVDDPRRWRNSSPSVLPADALADSFSRKVQR